jgi:hypothetical protein
MQEKNPCQWQSGMLNLMSRVSSSFPDVEGQGKKQERAKGQEKVWQM